MAHTKPLKRDKKVAADMLGQIRHMTARWHLGFSTVERTVIQRALERLIDA